MSDTGETNRGITITNINDKPKGFIIIGSDNTNVYVEELIKTLTEQYGYEIITMDIAIERNLIPANIIMDETKTLIISSNQIDIQSVKFDKINEPFLIKNDRIDIKEYTDYGPDKKYKGYERPYKYHK